MNLMLPAPTPTIPAVVTRLRNDDTLLEVCLLLVLVMLALAIAHRFLFT